jgi:hypothetical protein
MTAMPARTLPVTGVLPSRINENTRLASEWSGALQLAARREDVLFADVIGSGADAFDAFLDRATGLVTVAPFAALDFEAFAGAAPFVEITLRFFLSDGTQARSDRSWTVEVLDLDDTPPQALSFASGGSVAAGAAGAVIGRLSVRDPDTAPGRHVFTLSEDDAGFFEIQGDTLRLRDGVSIPLEDGPVRSVFVEVSDGFQSAGFLLPVTVTAPTDGLAVDLLQRWESRSGFFWDGAAVVGHRGAWAVEAVNAYGGDLVQVSLPDRTSIWFKGAERLELLNGRLDFRPEGTAAATWLAFDVLLGRSPSPGDFLVFTRALDAGLGLRQLFSSVTTSAEHSVKFGALDATAFVRYLYGKSSGWLSEEAVAWHAARINAGTPRGDVAADILSWALTDADAAHARAADGFWIPRPFANEVGALYLAALGREPDVGMWNWTNAWESGALTRQQIANFFITLPEGAARYAGVDNGRFVQMLYNQTLGREPEPEGLANWVGALAAGSITRGDAVLGFAFSAEATARYARLPAGDAFLF